MPAATHPSKHSAASDRRECRTIPAAVRYAIAARDNVSDRLGPRTQTVKARTR